MEQSFIAYIENSIKNNWDLDALTDYKGATLQYKDVARKIEKLHIIFEESGIRKGDKNSRLRAEQFPLGSHLSCYFDLRRSNCPHLT